jgi:GNAT superfamily N-acetyltransferase
MPTTFTVRSAEPSDAVALAEAWLDAGRYYAAHDARRFQVPEEVGLATWLSDLLAAPRGHEEIWLVVERDGDVLGDIKARIDPPREGGRYELVRDVTEPVLRIDALAVREADRRQGAGTTLMKAAEDWGRRRGASRSYLTTASGSELSVPFYESLHYERVSIGFWKQL